ncbi:MAG: hypothetical protein AAF633_08055 [Chloroflexota bacterium]
MKSKRSDNSTDYLIVVDGILHEHWQGWFDGLTITPQTNGYTHLEGSIRDQAELHGTLKRISNLGLKLISVNPHESSDVQS